MIDLDIKLPLGLASLITGFVQSCDPVRFIDLFIHPQLGEQRHALAHTW